MDPQWGSDRPARGRAEAGRRPWYWYVRYVALLLAVAGGFAVLIYLGAAAAAEWEQYPVVTLVAEAYDPSEPLRGAYVDLAVRGTSDRERRRVRFLAAEDEAKIIEGALRGRRGQTVILQARQAPDGRLRPVAVITADGRRFATR